LDGTLNYSTVSETTEDGPLRARLLETLLAGVPVDVILQRARASNPNAHEIKRHLEGIVRDLQAASHRREAAKAYALWMASVHRSLSGSSGIDVTTTLTPDEFFRDYYEMNWPVHIRGLDANCTLSRWTFDALRAEFGALPVQIMRDRIYGVPDYRDPEKHRSTMLLADFIDEIHVKNTNDIYLTSFNSAMSGPLRAMFDGFEPLPGILISPIGDSSLWIGPAGAKTPLHYDKTNVMLVQLIGMKRVTLYPPHDEPFLYHDEDLFNGKVDAFAPDERKHPLYRFASPHAVNIAAGEALFIPVSWWHAVESLTPTMSISISSFGASENYFPSNLF
jgi:hypothetical protein